ncbi:hypothetical protein Bca4012_090053 [Brassica carinata]
MFFLVFNPIKSDVHYEFFNVWFASGRSSVNLVRQVFIRCGQVPQNRKHKLYKIQTVKRLHNEWVENAGTAIRGGIQERLIRKFPETNWRTVRMMTQTINSMKNILTMTWAGMRMKMNDTMRG